VFAGGFPNWKISAGFLSFEVDCLLSNCGNATADFGGEVVVFAVGGGNPKFVELDVEVVAGLVVEKEGNPVKVTV